MEIWDWQKVRNCWQNFATEKEADFFPLIVLTDSVCNRGYHKHIFYEIAYIESGEADHLFYPADDKPLVSRLKRGDIVAIAPGVCHNFSNANQVKIRNLIFLPELPWFDFGGLSELPGLQRLLGNPPVIFHVPPFDQDKISTLFFELTRELFLRASGYRQKSVALLIELLVNMDRTLPKDSPEACRPARQIVTAIGYMKSNFTSAIRLEDIAKEAKIGKTYLCHLFKQEIGMTPWEYLTRLRLEHARFLLQTSSDLSVSEIAFCSGFEDNGYFARLFRRSEGKSPSEYSGRKLAK